jgi:hypothetical protein
MNDAKYKNESVIDGKWRLMKVWLMEKNVSMSDGKLKK